MVCPSRNQQALLSTLKSRPNPTLKRDCAPKTALPLTRTLSVMKNFLFYRRSIATSISLGAITALVVFFGLLVADFAVSLYTSNFGPFRQIDAIAVGGGYSISFDATPAHLMLAEYKQSVAIYGGGPRDGALIGRVDIPMNTGGRIRIGILVPQDAGKHEAVLLDRYATTRIDLAKQSQKQEESNWRNMKLKSIGWVSGESYPVKFIPCSVWPLISPQEKDSIIGSDRELRGFCDAIP